MTWTLLASILGCGSPSVEPAAPTPAPTPAPEAAVTRAGGLADVDAGWAKHRLQRHMQGHFSAAIDAVWFLATDDLSSMRELAGAMRPTADLDPALRPLEVELMNSTLDWARAPDREAAAQQSAVVASRCAACHEKSGAIIAPTAADLQVPELTSTGHHVVAPYLLWVGLIVPSDIAWAEGAGHLVLPEARPGTETQRASYEALAAKAKTAPASERGAVWTELLTSCTPCHEAGGVDLSSE